MNIVSDFINNDILPFKINETVLTILDFFNEEKFTHFAVNQDDTFIGMVSKNEAETYSIDKRLTDYRYSLEPFFVQKSMSWIEILAVFAKNDANIVAVLDNNHQYLGYYELENIIQYFNETPFLKENGSIIIIKKPIIDYSMGQITQIIESNNGKLLGLFVSNSDGNDVEIIIKIAVGNVNEIIQSFRRYEYEIVSNHNEDSFMSVLKERSDYLERYLSI